MRSNRRGIAAGPLESRLASFCRHSVFDWPCKQANSKYVDILSAPDKGRSLWSGLYSFPEGSCFAGAGPTTRTIAVGARLWVMPDCFNPAFTGLFNSIYVRQLACPGIE